MSKLPSDLQRQEARVVQMQAVQMLLHSMDVLGEHTGCFQMEMDGVLESIVIRRVTQKEFDTIVKDAARAEARASAPRTDGA